MKERKIIFVCTGNTCRSVIAEMLFKKMVAEEIRKNPEKKAVLENLRITSAGIAPIPGMNTAPGTVRVLREEGIEAADHRARRLTSGEVREACRVLVMEERQRAEVSRIAGCCEEKIRHLNEFLNGREKDISDPFGHSLEVYAECRDNIKKALEKLLNKISTGEIQA